jgi:thiamine-phosphate pyrophosphorylase
MPGFDVILVTDGKPDLEARVIRALAGSLPERCAVLLRERALPAGAQLTLLRALRTPTREKQVALLVSDRVDVALLGDADGVHLPEAGLSVAEARQLVGSQRFVGASRHDAEGTRAAAAQGADYATLSPVFPTPGKGAALLVTGFEAVARESTLPLYALGGVDSARVAELVQAGAAGVAVMREVLSAHDPAQALRRLLSALDAAETRAASRVLDPGNDI